MRTSAIIIATGLILAGCGGPPPPANEMERHARLAAMAEIAATNCGAHVGGFASTREMRAEADRNAQRARQLGATDGDMNQARQAAQATYQNAVLWIGPSDACSTIVSGLGWSAG